MRIAYAHEKIAFPFRFSFSVLPFLILDVGQQCGPSTYHKCLKCNTQFIIDAIFVCTRENCICSAAMDFSLRCESPRRRRCRLTIYIEHEKILIFKIDCDDEMNYRVLFGVGKLLLVGREFWHQHCAFDSMASAGAALAAAIVTPPTSPNQIPETNAHITMARPYAWDNFGKHVSNDTQHHIVLHNRWRRFFSYFITTWKCARCCLNAIKLDWITTRLTIVIYVIFILSLYAFVSTAQDSSQFGSCFERNERFLPRFNHALAVTETTYTHYDHMSIHVWRIIPRKKKKKKNRKSNAIATATIFSHNENENLLKFPLPLNSI